MARESNNAVAIPRVKLESILLSIKEIETYKAAVQKLKAFHLSDPTPDNRKSKEYNLLERYTYLVDQQLNHEIPTMNNLINALSSVDGFNFKDQPTFPDSEVLQNVELYLTRQDRLRSAKDVEGLSETIIDYGITEDVITKCEKILSSAKVERSFEPISERYKEMWHKDVEFSGVSFLCPELDKRTGGMIPGSLAVMLGASGCMKTTTTVNICYNAIKEGKNVIYLSLEESPMQLYSKLLSRVSVDVGKPLDTSNMIKQVLDEKEQAILFNEVEPYLNSLPGKFYIVGEEDLGNYSLGTFENKLADVDALMQEKTGHGADIVVVDHIQLLKYADSHRDEFSTINMYVSFFRQQSLSFLHKKKQIIVILLSQSNRDGMDYARKHDGHYLMTHVAEASEIERSASYIISTYTDAMTQVSKLLKMGAIKLRNAALPMDTINVYADGTYYQVGETSTPEQKEYNMNDLDLGIDLGDATPQSNTSINDILAEFDL